MNRNMREIYDYIDRYWRENRYGPSYREIAEATGKGSVSGVHRTVGVLIDEGYLVRGGYGRSRTVRPRDLNPSQP